MFHKVLSDVGVWLGSFVTIPPAPLSVVLDLWCRRRVRWRTSVMQKMQCDELAVTLQSFLCHLVVPIPALRLILPRVALKSMASSALVSPPPSPQCWESLNSRPCFCSSMGVSCCHHFRLFVQKKILILSLLCLKNFHLLLLLIFSKVTPKFFGEALKTF